MSASQNPEVYLGRTAVDSQGNKIGSVGQVYLDDRSGEANWITVNTGLFGMKENFAPLYGSTMKGDDELVLPFDKDVVKDSPDIDDASHLSVTEQEQLHSYYQSYLGESTADGAAGGGAGNAAQMSAPQTDSAAGNDYRAAGYDTSGPTTDEAMTRSEEQLNVGTETVEAGRARLRKYVVTEEQTVSVPVSHEEVRVVREPINDANGGDALDGPQISEEEHEVVLHAERPVVETEAVPVERVRLGTETVSETEDVSGTVRKEQIEVNDDSANTSGQEYNSGNDAPRQV